MRSRVLGVFEDQTKRSAALLIAVLANLVVLSLDQGDVFDRSPMWVELVFFWGVEVLVVLPLLIACGVFMIRDRRRRKRQQPAE